MTAEIAIINKSAVALAADSAVTIPNAKIYNQANKLFELSKVHPVGIMIFGSADFMGVPWEVIIKSFRAKLKSKNYDYLEGFADEFFKFLRKNKFKSNVVHDNYVHSVIVNVFDDMHNRIKAQNVTKRNFHKEFRDHADAILDAICQNETLKISKELNLETFKEKYSDSCRTLVTEIFEGYYVSKANHKLALELIFYFLIHSTPSDTFSGVVISGFGKKDLFPKLLYHRVDGAVCGLPRIIRMKMQSIQDSHDKGKHPARIYSFAQMDVSSLFIEGLTPDNLDYFTAAFEQALHSFTSEILKVAGYGPNQNQTKISKRLLKSKIEEFSSEFALLAERYRRDKHINPTLNIVSNLPKEEMANMAESLVELTSLKRKVSFEQETVGGPVDVAIISKGDGFVWMKRKFYFPEELNKSFNERQSKKYC